MDAIGISIHGKANHLPLYSKIEDPSSNLKNFDVDLNPTTECMQQLEESVDETAPNFWRPDRIHAFDNLRTVLIVLLVFEHAILETVSTAKVSEESKSHRALTIFVGMTRAHVVGMLYFISGFASRFSMTINSSNPLVFLVKKVGRSAIAILACYSINQAIRYLYGPWPETTGTFYSTLTGKETLMNGPMHYIVLLLMLDTAFAILRFLSLCIGMVSHRKTITTEFRYRIATYTLLTVVDFWTMLYGMGYITLPPRITALFSAVDGTQPLFPSQYIISYFAGIHFMAVWRFVLFEVQPELRMPVFIVRTFISTGTLYAMFHYYPDAMQEFFSLTTAQTMKFPLSAISSGSFLNHLTIPWYIYVMWSIGTYFILPTCTVALFFSKKALNKDWGLFSRTAFTQPFIHMIFVVGFARLVGQIQIDNIMLRCGFVGMASVVCGWSVAVAFAILVRFGRQLLVDVRSPPGVTDEEKNII